MQKVLTAAQMREVDRLTTEEYGIPSIILMENAAHAVARVITGKLGGSVKGKSILILCGPGNNGGDGAALARILWIQGANLQVFLFGKVEQMTGDARVNFDICKSQDIVGNQSARTKDELKYFSFHEVDSFSEFCDRTKFQNEDVCVDALFGTGLNRRVEGDLASLISTLNHWIPQGRRSLIVSIDLPSGMVADNTELFPIRAVDVGKPNDVFSSVQPDLTVTFTAPKPALVLAPAIHQSKETVVVDIGSPESLIVESPSQLFVAERNDGRAWLLQSRFTDDSYKNKRGHGLIIAGSKNYTGAAVLAADAAMRSGVGLVTLAVPDGAREAVVARVMPEVMVRGISETKEGSASEKAVGEITGFLKNVDAIAIGSGLSTNDETSGFVRRMVDERTMPMVIDADGLTALSPFDTQGSDELPLILTPHEGEFMRLLETEDKDAIKDRVAAVRDFATKHHVILVLKGERVLIGEPGGKVVVNPTGNSGLGKAGNGDTLTGILAGFVAQAVQMKIDIFETVVAACYVAGMAGDVAEKKYGKRVMTASDVRECLVEVFEELGR